MKYFTQSSQGWREIGGKKIYARSTWEANFARYLEFRKKCGFIKEWFHEPKTFYFAGIKRGTNNYKPDFMVDYGEGKCGWFEVKGWMDPKSKTKIARFARYFPDETLTVIDGKWFKSNSSKLRLLIKDWEKGNAPQTWKKQICYKIQHQDRDGSGEAPKAKCCDSSL